MTKTQLVGVLELASKYRYGLTSRGTPLYLFCPYDEAAPQFIVGSNCRDLSVNQIAIVEVPFPYEKPAAPAKPRGNLLHLIGPVGEFVCEQTALIYHYCPHRAVASLPPPPLSGPNTARDAERIEISKEAGWHVFHVDPPGCRDIDDAIAFHPATGQWAITIADVAAVVPADCEADIRARAVGGTFYDTKGSVILLMLTPALSEDAASLLPGQRRRGVSLVWRPTTSAEFLHLSDGEEPVFVSSWITVEHSFTYESFAASPFAHETLGVPCDIGHLDAHDFIAALMVRYNAAAARVLKNRGAGGVLRVQCPSTAEKLAAWPPALRHLASEAAVYMSAAEAATSSWHTGLALDAYTHASSPLRRYADLINQRVLVDVSAEAAVVDVEHLNARAKANKRWGRDIAFLTHVPPGRVHEVDVVWLAKEIDHSPRGQADGLWKVWVPAWQRTLRLRHRPSTPGAPGTAGRIAVYCDPTRRNWKRRVLTADMNSQSPLSQSSAASTSPAAAAEPPSEL
jgi:exoribonuclease R